MAKKVRDIKRNQIIVLWQHADPILFPNDKLRSLAERKFSS